MANGIRNRGLHCAGDMGHCLRFVLFITLTSNIGGVALWWKSALSGEILCFLVHNLQSVAVIIDLLLKQD